MPSERMFEDWIRTYGPFAVFLGVFLEGETVLVMAGFAAHRGYMPLSLVLVVAFAATLAADQLYFFLGRRYGESVLRRRPGWRAPAARVRALLERRSNWVILAFRFWYGFRTITPFALGTSHVPAPRFLALNAVGAAVWTVLFGVAGYLFGHALEVAIGRVEHYEAVVFAALAAAGLTTWLVVHQRRKRRS